MADILARLALQNDNGTYPDVDFMSTALLAGSSTIQLQSSTHTTTDLEDGLVMESFVLFYKALSPAITANVRLIQNHFELARTLHNSGSPHERVRLLSQVQDEVDSRVSTVIGGTIEAVPNTVLPRGHKRDGALYAVTIQRYKHFDYGTPVVISSAGLSVHGGTITMPKGVSTGIQSGRIKTSTLVTVGDTKVKRVWQGIKPAHTSLDGFDPQIKIQDASGNWLSKGNSIITDSDCFQWRGYPGGVRKYNSMG